MEDKTWGGRFTEKTDRRVEAFTASIDFDKRLYSHDIDGSIVTDTGPEATGEPEAADGGAPESSATVASAPPETVHSPLSGAPSGSVIACSRSVEDVIDLAVAVSFPQRFSVQDGNAQMAQAGGEHRAVEAAQQADSDRDAAALAKALRDQQAVAPADSPVPATERLAQLDHLRAQGLVTDEEYQAKRQKILDELSEIQEKIAGYLEILNSDERLNAVLIEEQLRSDRDRSEANYRTLFEEMLDAFALHELIVDDRDAVPGAVGGSKRVSSRARIVCGPAVVTVLAQPAKRRAGGRTGAPE